MMTMEFLKLQLAAARRLLKKGSYNHVYCNMHEGEKDAHLRCTGCIREKDDRNLVFEKGVGL